MSIEVEYLKYQITYREDDNEWSCWELKFAEKSLKAIKAKIAAFDADTRRVPRVKAFLLQRYGDEPEAIQITMIADDGECWVSKKRGRSKEKMDTIAPDTTETRAAIKAWQAALATARAATKAAEALKKDIPRVTRKHLDELRVAAAEAET